MAGLIYALCDTAGAALAYVNAPPPRGALAGAMPRYFFDIDDGEKISPDAVGLELASDHEAQQEAVRALPGIAKDVLPDGPRRDFVIEVRDATRRPFLRARLSLTVETILDS